MRSGIKDVYIGVKKLKCTVFFFFTIHVFHEFGKDALRSGLLVEVKYFFNYKTKIGGICLE